MLPWHTIKKHILYAGSLPESWSQLAKLRNLDLSFNFITGALTELTCFCCSCLLLKKRCLVFAPAGKASTLHHTQYNQAWEESGRDNYGML